MDCGAPFVLCCSSSKAPHLWNFRMVVCFRFIPLFATLVQIKQRNPKVGTWVPTQWIVLFHVLRVVLPCNAFCFCHITCLSLGYTNGPSCKNVMCSNWWETPSDNITIKLSYYLNWTIIFCFKKVFFKRKYCILIILAILSYIEVTVWGMTWQKFVAEENFSQGTYLFFKIANRRKLPRNLKTII